MKQRPKIQTLHVGNPSQLLDILIERQALKNDAALCRTLQIAPPVISKIRHGRNKISADLMIRIHETFQMPFSEIRQFIESNQPLQPNNGAGDM